MEWLTEDQQRIWRTYLLGAQRVDRFLDQDLRGFGMDLGEYEILVQLSEAEDQRLRMSELAELAHQSRSRLTHTVTRMERDGLVCRSTCPTDRRGVWAKLTDKGHALLVKAAPSHVRAVRRILIDAVDPSDLAALGRIFTAVLAVEDSAHDDPGAH